MLSKAFSRTLLLRASHSCLSLFPCIQAGPSLDTKPGVSCTLAKGRRLVCGRWLALSVVVRPVQATEHDNAMLLVSATVDDVIVAQANLHPNPNPCP